MPKVLKYCLFITLTLLCLTIYGQSDNKKERRKRKGIQKELKEKKSDQDEKKEKVKLIRADALKGAVVDGKDVRVLKGNVIFKQGDVFMYCDSSYQYLASNSLDAFGNVRIVEGEKMTLTGNKAHYDGNTKIANVIGDVLLKDEKMTLTTNLLNYNLNTRIGYYYSGGKIIDGKNTLTSTKGSYDSNTKLFAFRDSVKLVNDDYIITCDTMQYSTTSKITYFKGPTKIDGKDGVLFAKNGTYNSVTGESDFSKDAAIDNKDYNLMGDELHYDDDSDFGYARGNVRLHLKESGIIIYADYGQFDEKTKITRSHGHILMKYAMGNDTMYLKSDTLISLQDSQKLKRLDAYYHVRIYKKDMKAKCDSLSYLVSDSLIQFYNDPVLWADESQITGDYIEMTMSNDEIDKLYITKNAFMVSQDSLKNFNQIKGNDMVAHFDSSNLYQMDVKGDGKSIYYALEEDTAITGLNKTECENMIFKLDSNQIKFINFLKQPKATFYPPDKIQPNLERLDGFSWRKSEEPKRSEFIVPFNRALFMPESSFKKPKKGNELAKEAFRKISEKKAAEEEEKKED